MTHSEGAGDAAASAAAVQRDAVLVRRVRQGDRDAYGELVRTHTRRAYAIAYGILRHREDAEDAVQDAFARTLQRIPQLDAARPFHPWFYRIVVNTAISFRRARSVRATAPLPDGVRSTGVTPEQAAERGELRERLLRALDRLPERQRVIVLLADVEELNSSEIAAVLEMPAGSVRYQLHLARRALREVLSAADEEARS